MAELHTLTTGMVVGESPRWHEDWHEDRLWFSDWGALVLPDGSRRRVAEGVSFPKGMA